MKISRQKLFRLSRDRRFLVRAAIVIAVASLVIGLLISIFTTSAGVTPFSSSRRLDRSVLNELGKFADPSELTTPQMAVWIRDPDHLLAIISKKLAGSFDRMDEQLDVDDFLKELEAAVLSFVESSISKTEKIDSSDRKLLLDLFNGLHGEDREADEALESLKSAAATDPPRRYTSEFLADVLAHREEVDPAIENYRNEIDRFSDSASHSRQQIVWLLQVEEREEELRELFADPEYRKSLPILDRMELATELGDWGSVLRDAIALDLKIGDPGLFSLSLIAGFIWLVIVTQFSGYGRTRVILYLAALVLGWFSATATIFVVFIQDFRGFTHDPQDPLLQQLIYCVAGIGLREETLKLLLFVPLVPFLYRRGSEIEALVCAGLVGLGFAINENSGYVGAYGAFTAWGRFFTANFLHIAMTGVIGLSFFRMCRRPRQRWDNFLYDFLIIVAIHGGYDALLMVPALDDYSLLYLVVYALTAYLFLDQATGLMGSQASHTVSPLATFVLGSAILAGVVLAYASWGEPFRDSLTEYIGSLAEMLPIAFVFINRFRAH